MKIQKNIKDFGLSIKNCKSCDKCPLNNLNISCSEVCRDGDISRSLEKMYASCKDFIAMVDNYKPPVLDEVEKKYLKNLLRPFVNNYNITVTKETDNYLGKEFLVIELYVNTVCTDTVELPYFKPNTMYKGMESHKIYTLKDLGLKF